MGEGKVFGGNLCFTTGALLGRQDCGIFVFLPFLPLPFCPFFGSDLEMSHHPLAIQWPPTSVGPSLLTPQLRDGPKRGLAFQPARAMQSPPGCPPTLAHFRASRPPTWPPFLVATEELPFWICHPHCGG